MRLGGSRDFIGRLLAVLALACAMIFPQATSALAGQSVDDINDPMKFVIVRSSTPFCEPNCPEFIWARGAIETTTSSAFSKFLKKIGNRKLPVVVSSPGGSVDAAYKMGRMIRERKLEVGVGSVYLTACPASWPDCEAQQKKTGIYSGVIVDYGTYCNSACPLLLAAGTTRLAGPTTYVGVHQITTTYTREKVRYREKYKIVKGKKRVIETKVVSRKKVGTYQTTKLSKSSERSFLAYLKDMGVAKSYFTAAQGTPAKDMRQLFKDELRAMNLTTGDEPAVVFARAGRCDKPAPAANCVLREGYGGEKPAANQPIAPKVAPEAPAMDFVVTRGVGMTCAPICRDWISAEGKIAAETPEKLESVLKKLGNPSLPLVISSKGGDIDAAIALGQLARKHRLVVVVGGTAISGCQAGRRDCVADASKTSRHDGIAKSHGGVCINECALVLAGGVQRLAGPDTVIAWAKAGTMPRVVTDKAEAHLKAMGVNPRMLGETSVGPLGDRTQWRLFRMNLLTATLAVETVLSGHVCKGTPAPNICFTAEANR